MKLKKIFAVSLLLLSVFLIYLTTMDKKVYYLALGDSIALGTQVSYPKLVKEFFEQKDLLEEFHNEFIKDDLRITDLIEYIKDNKKITVDGKEKTIKNALIKADLVTISIGNEELFYKMKTEKPDNLYNYIDEMMEDMKQLFDLIKEYCKEDVFILGYINPISKEMEAYIQYANEKLETLTKKYHFTYVSLEPLKKENNIYNGLNLNDDGQKKIGNLLLPVIEKKIIRDE